MIDVQKIEDLARVCRTHGVVRCTVSDNGAITLEMSSSMAVASSVYPAGVTTPEASMNAGDDDGHAAPEPTRQPRFQNLSPADPLFDGVNT